MTIDWYKEFVNLDYEPVKDDLICLYYFEPAAGIGAGKLLAG
jgi:ribulose-bisphosphate carboxylase large chain